MTQVFGGLAGIGNTPLVRLRRIVPEGAAEVWIKLEGGNPTGSYKDRMAVSVLGAAMQRGALRSGDTVVEYTGGSTGTALAFVSAVLGLRFVAVFSDAFSKSKRQAMEAFGALVLVEDSGGGGITTELIARMRDRALDLARQPGHYYADQFGSPEARRGYRPMGTEIAAALDGAVDVVCAGIGTGAALMGTAEGLRAVGVTPGLVALEPAEAPLLSRGGGGAHRIEGVAVTEDPPFLDRGALRAIRTVRQGDAFAMCRRLAREEGIFAGGSTGLNVCAAIELAVTLGAGKRVVTFACDNGFKYLASGIYG